MTITMHPTKNAANRQQRRDQKREDMRLLNIMKKGKVSDTLGKHTLRTARRGQQHSQEYYGPSLLAEGLVVAENLIDHIERGSFGGSLLVTAACNVVHLTLPKEKADSLRLRIQMSYNHLRWADQFPGKGSTRTN